MKNILILLIIIVATNIQSIAQDSKSGKIGIGYSGVFTSSTNDFI